MINKDIVEKIILMNDKVTLEKRQKPTSNSDIDINRIAYTKTQHELLNFIENLNREDLFDLCGLMDYGRELYQKGIANADMKEYSQMRESFKNNHIDDMYLSNYLISKGENLSIYLKNALLLFNQKKSEFNFQSIILTQGQRLRCLLCFLKYLLAAAAMWSKKARCAAASLTQKNFKGAAIFRAARQNAPYICFARSVPSRNQQKFCAYFQGQSFSMCPLQFLYIPERDTTIFYLLKI